MDLTALAARKFGSPSIRGPDLPQRLTEVSDPERLTRGRRRWLLECDSGEELPRPGGATCAYDRRDWKTTASQA